MPAVDGADVLVADNLCVKRQNNATQLHCKTAKTLNTKNSVVSDDLEALDGRESDR